MSEIINLNDTTPAAPAGAINVKWQKGTSTGTDPSTGLPIYPASANISIPIPTIIGFVIALGTIGTNVGPMLAAPHAGAVTKCVVCVKGSDASVPLTFTIKQNGTDVFSTDPTVSPGAATGSLFSFSALTSNPLSVAAGDVFSIDISSGSSSWIFTTQLE